MMNGIHTFWPESGGFPARAWILRHPVVLPRVSLAFLS